MDTATQQRMLSFVKRLSKRCNGCLYKKGTASCNGCPSNEAETILRDYQNNVAEDIGGQGNQMRYHDLLAKIASLCGGFAFKRTKVTEIYKPKSRQLTYKHIGRLIRLGMIEMTSTDGWLRFTPKGIETYQAYEEEPDYEQKK